MSSPVVQYSFSYLPQPYLDPQDRLATSSSSQNTQENTSVNLRTPPKINPTRGYLTEELFRQQKLPFDPYLTEKIPVDALDFWKKSTEGLSLVNNLIKTMSSPTKRFATFHGREYFIFFHSKNDQTTIKFGSLINVGSKKMAWRVIQVGPIQKMYCLLVPIHSRLQPELTREFLMTKKLEHPNIAVHRNLVKKGFTWNTTTDKTIQESPIATGLKATLYSAGTAERFTKNPPKNAAEIYERIQIIYDITKALIHIHSFRVENQHLRLAHTDVKPANIFLTVNRNGLSGVLGDINAQREGLTSFYATPAYLPPELGRNLLLTYDGELKSEFPTASQAADIWALGISLFRMIYGERRPPRKPSTENPGFYQLNYLAFCSRLYSRLSAQPVDSLHQKVNLLILCMLNPTPTLRITARDLLPTIQGILISSSSYFL